MIRLTFHCFQIDSLIRNFKCKISAVWSIDQPLSEQSNLLFMNSPKKLLVDQRNSSNSLRWLRLCDMIGIKLQLSDVESHYSLGYVERYHAPLPKVYLKVRHDTRKVREETDLRLSIKAPNDTMGLKALY